VLSAEADPAEAQSADGQWDEEESEGVRRDEEFTAATAR
jgi:hypothetical protein